MAKTCECPPRSKHGPTTVARPTNTTTAGSTATTYTNIKPVQCRWVRKSGREETSYGARRVRREWETEIDAKDDVDRGDKCTFTDATGEHVVYVVDTAVHATNEDWVIVEAEEIT